MPINYAAKVHGRYLRNLYYCFKNMDYCFISPEKGSERARQLFFKFRQIVLPVPGRFV